MLRFFVLRHGVIAASRGGKVKTLLQSDRDRAVPPAAGRRCPPRSTRLRWAVMAVAVGLTVITGLDYLVKALRPRSRTV